MSRVTFEMSDAMRLTGIKRSQVEWAIRQGIVCGRAQQLHAGTGNRRRFTYINLVELSAFVVTRKLRLPVALARVVMAQIRSRGLVQLRGQSTHIVVFPCERQGRFTAETRHIESRWEQHLGSAFVLHIGYLLATLDREIGSVAA